ncbi:Hsp70 family protein [Parasalinivibrio latis]|uniref:Hsp70 family protein n=1 Tax=Parasalinivibrio latis TaxID=2952610 RepID=UPI0030E2B700
MVQQVVGIDFGTTNSLISVVTHDGRVSSFYDLGRPHPSVVRYETDQVICGRSAKEKLETTGVGVLGNTVRGPKKLLNQSMIKVDGRLINPTEVVTDFVKYLKNDALQNDNSEAADLTRAVVTIPVDMNGEGRVALREAFLNAGIYIESFVHEPLAALYAYYKDQPDPEDMIRRHENHTVLVFDWGGGTLDLTLCKIKNGALVQIQNKGNNTVGGDYLDEAILSYVEKQHALKHHWTDEKFLERNPGMKAKLLVECEKAKIALSSRDVVPIWLDEYYQGDGPEAEIDISLTRETLEKVCSTLIHKGMREIDILLSPDHADIDPQTIALCLATGGMVNMPSIKRQLSEIFGVAALHISPKGDTIISEGAARIAADKLSLTLAKPFELLEARNSVVTLLKEGTVLPSRGTSIRHEQSMYCTDPRDGNALLMFKRPLMVGKSGASDARVNLGSLSVPVNKEFPPLSERILVEVVIDDNLIAHATAVGSDKDEPVTTQFYELEFALRVVTTEQEQKKKPFQIRPSRSISKGVIALANVARKNDLWNLVPGELLKQINDTNPYMRKDLTEQQRLEFVRYQPCLSCGSKWGKNCCNA